MFPIDSEYKRVLSILSKGNLFCFYAECSMVKSMHLPLNQGSS